MRAARGGQVHRRLPALRKAINYRSECFFERELAQIRAGFTPDEAQDYGAYTNGDMATPRPEAYIGDPYKILLTNADSEMGHVFHEHGGAIRWLRNPGAANPDIAGGLEKHPPVTKASIRLDSQTIEPGESYDLETECGAGGCQQAAGDFLYHCHIAAHYDAGMVGYIRVFDTQQPDLPTVPGRTAKPQAVTSAGLIGKVIEGKTVVPQDQLTNPSTQVSVQQLVSSQLPPQGARFNQEDSTVWDWTWGGTADQPVALGEPEDTHVWADYTAPNPGQRPQIMFDPSNGRYAWPLLQPHLGERPPFSPNGHSGAPWLGPERHVHETGRPVPAGRSDAHLQHHRHPDPHPRSDGQRARRQREPHRPAVRPQWGDLRPQPEHSGDAEWRHARAAAGHQVRCRRLHSRDPDQRPEPVERGGGGDRPGEHSSARSTSTSTSCSSTRRPPTA